MLKFNLTNATHRKFWHPYSSQYKKVQVQPTNFRHNETPLSPTLPPKAPLSVQLANTPTTQAISYQSFPLYLCSFTHRPHTPTPPRINWFPNSYNLCHPSNDPISLPYQLIPQQLRSLCQLPSKLAFTISTDFTTATVSCHSPNAQTTSHCNLIPQQHRFSAIRLTSNDFSLKSGSPTASFLCLPPQHSSASPASIYRPNRATNKSPLYIQK